MRERRDRLTGASVLATVLCLGMASSVSADMSGSWAGQFVLPTLGKTVDAAAALADARGRLNGTIVFALEDPTLAAAFVVQGRVAGGRLRLSGANPAGVTVTVRGASRHGILHGVARLRGATGTTKGRITLEVQAGRTDASACDAVFTQNTAFFTSEVLGTVLVPRCLACHGAGGQAQTTRLRVVPGDPAATARSTALVAHPTDAAQALLVRKPQGLVAHGGGERITPGGAEAQVLTQWATLLAQSGCVSSSGTGADLFVARCGSCHGADARGLADRPDVRCTARSLLNDAVRFGRGAGPDAMPAFTTIDLPATDLDRIAEHLRGLCTGKPKDVYASNCATCHGPTAGGGRNANGVGGPNIRCRDAGDFAEVLASGEDAMPAFPSFSSSRVSALATFVHRWCSLGGGGGD